MAVPQPFAGRLPAASTRLTHLTRLAGVRRPAGPGAAAPAAGAAEDAWPSKPIRVIVPYTPAARPIRSRAWFSKVGERLKQTIIVENRPGANSTVGTTVAARAKGDGYTFRRCWRRTRPIPACTSRCPTSPPT